MSTNLVLLLISLNLTNVRHLKYERIKKINKQKLTALFILSKGIFCLILKQVFFFICGVDFLSLFLCLINLFCLK